MSEGSFRPRKAYNLKKSDFNTSRRPTWCLGCGNFGIWNSVKAAFVDSGLYPHEILIVYGIGCAGNGANFMKSYAFHCLHGRALPLATGAKLANHKMCVLAVGGDGDGIGIGGNHFIHTCRRNIDITYIMHDNRIYGLTTGQASPTSIKGFKSKSTPSGVIESSINPVSLALVTGASFVARGFSGDTRQLSEIITLAIAHKGFSFIDVLQPCVTFNRVDTYESYHENVYKLEDDPGFDNTDISQALKKSMETEKIATGIFYDVDKPTYEEELKQIERKPLVDHIISDIDITKTLLKYT
jgi:2-oxoglutarate/2-oxoacid ferredoxin oxidoreductase subunit beta